TDRTPAQVQVVPVESLIKPGEKVLFKAQLFNALGQDLGEAKDAKFTIEGPGQIDAAGTYTAESAPQHSGVIVTAKVGDVAGKARVRVIPPLPWKFDFSDKQVPVTWIGMRYRHVIRDLDGDQVMVKITTIPLGTKSQGWFGSRVGS